MERFVVGLLEENEPESYEGTVYDAWLTVRLPAGQLRRVFDPDLLAVRMPAGTTYTFVLVAFMPSDFVYSMAPSEIHGSAPWAGRVLAATWRPHGLSFEHAHKDLVNRDWILVQTDDGELLLDKNEIQSNVAVGGAVSWTDCRLDLIAIR